MVKMRLILISCFLPFLLATIVIAQLDQEDMLTEEESMTSEPILCPSLEEPYYPLSYLDSRAQSAQRAIRAGETLNAHYYFAKLDEAPQVLELLKKIISDNYTSDFFNATLDFIHNIRNASTRLQGYQFLLDSIMADRNFSMSRGELFRLAHYLKTQVDFFDPYEFANITNRFSQGIKAIVFEPYFTIKNIHDSYVFHYKRNTGEESGYWCLTGKCKRCNESRLVAEPNADFSLFTIRNPTLTENCLGVKNNKAIIWTEEEHEEFCDRERWQIRFVGKTIAMIVYQPKGNSSESARGFGLTRAGFNKKVTLESTHYLNSNQIWLTT